MIHFKCQLDWVKRCPDSRQELFLGVSVKMLLEEIHILMRHSVKKITPPPVPKVSKHHPTSWGFKETKKVEGGWILFLSLSLSWDLLLILLSFLGLQILEFVPVLPPYYSPSAFLKPSNVSRIIQLAFLVFQLTDSRLLNFSAPATVGTIPISNLLSHISICILLVLFLWRTLTNISTILLFSESWI